jgi:hypothetical protein
LVDSIPAAGTDSRRAALEADILEVVLEPDMQEEKPGADMQEEEPGADMQEEEPGIDILKEVEWWGRRPAGALPIPEVRLLAADYNRN